MLRPLARSTGGPLPGPARGYSVEITRDGRDVPYTISATVEMDGEQRPAPIVTCGLAVERPEYVWEILARAVEDPGRPVPATMPASTPWLGVVIHQTAIVAGPEDLQWIADFERCMAWTLLEERVQ